MKKVSENKVAVPAITIKIKPLSMVRAIEPANKRPRLDTVANERIYINRKKNEPSDILTMICKGEPIACV